MTLPTTPAQTSRQAAISRLLTALDRAYRVVARPGVPLPVRPILRGLRPRLERSLAADPERVIALLTWAWARIPEVIGDQVDLADHERVAAIVALVERHEFGAEPEAAVAAPADAAASG